MPEEQRPTGALPDPHDPRDIQLASLMPATVAIELPKKFSRRSEFWFKAFRQRFGSCVGCQQRYLTQFYRAKWNGEKKERSERFIYGRAKELDGRPDDEGTWPRISLMGAMGQGSPEQSRWPTKGGADHKEFIQSPPPDIREEAIQGTLPGGIASVRTYEELKRAIFTWGPVAVSLRVLNTYDQEPADGKLQPSDGNGYRGNHANIALGWDDEANGGRGAIELMNSWGESWADDGFGWLPMNYDPANNFPLSDMWAITDQIDPNLTSGAPVELGYPVQTPTPYITQAFGARPEYYAKYGMKGHNGLDFRTIDGNKKIIAAADGEIISMNDNDGGYGKAVRIAHPWGQSIYGHNSAFVGGPYAPDGTRRKVKRGEIIAIAGSTGDSSAEHCHFGIRINGVSNPGFYDWVDPTPYFTKGTTVTKKFRIKQGNDMGILLLEGFTGSGLFEDKWIDYQTLLKINGMDNNTPLIELPAGKFFRLQDGQKAGILVRDGFACSAIYENDFAEYQELLKIAGMSMANPLVQVP